MNKFYYVFNPSHGQPRKQYTSLEKAKQDAESIAKQQPNEEVYVLEAKCVYKSECVVKYAEPESDYSKTTSDSVVAFQTVKNDRLYCGEFRSKQIWLALQEAPQKMNWEDAKKWCEEQGGILPDKDTLLWLYLNREKINDALQKNNGDNLDKHYWSSTEYYINFAWSVNPGNGYTNYSNKTYTNYVRCVFAF